MVVYRILLLIAGFCAWAAYAAQPAPSAPMLAAHNAVRADVGVPPLAWSDALARAAAAWADTLAEKHACEMRHAEVAQGENLFWASPVQWSNGRTEVQAITPAQVVQDWASERADYDAARNTCRARAQCGHYTQVIWRETTTVGCARRVCADKAQIWVCRYLPPGNVVGQQPY